MDIKLKVYGKNFQKLKINTCVEKRSKLFINSAKKTFGTKRSRNIKEEKSIVSVSKKKHG
jgi:hypothetical protein